MSQKNIVHRKILHLQKFFDFHHQIITTKNIILPTILFSGVILNVFFLVHQEFRTLIISSVSLIAFYFLCQWLFRALIRKRFKKLTYRVTRFDCEKIKNYLEQVKQHYDFNNLKRFKQKIRQNSRFYCLTLEYFKMSEKYYKKIHK